MELYVRARGELPEYLRFDRRDLARSGEPGAGEPHAGSAAPILRARAGVNSSSVGYWSTWSWIRASWNTTRPTSLIRTLVFGVTLGVPKPGSVVSALV